ncbi:MAG: hypothetical protein KA020_01750 [Planctomycetes bacterium]|nr:hypothetical protein [Planctomycetota bacterium]
MRCFVIAAITAFVLYWLTAFYPPQSEDWVHLEIIASRPSWLGAFNLQDSHSRPLWFVSLWSMLPTGLERAELIRIPLYAMHALIGGLVGVLAQSLGASRDRALFAVLLFLCFPAVKGLSWIVAISTPEHVLLMMLALVIAAAHVKRPRAATGIALVVTQVLAVGAHSAACLLPGCVAMLAIGVSPLRLRVLLDRWLLLHFAVGAGLILLLASLPATERYHTLRSFEAIFANGSRALLSLMPELVRYPAIQGLRGAYGGLGLLFGLVTCGAVAALFVWLLWRSNAVGRALLLAAVIDLVPPVLTAGFVVRYAYFPAALVAVALLLQAKPTRSWIVALGVLGAAWIGDHVVDIAEVRRGGQLGVAVVEAARAVRAEVGPGVEVALVDAPGEVGAERDVPVFNWGLAVALRRNGVDGPWRLLRTERYITNSDVALVDEHRLEEIVREGVAVWRWDEASGRYLRR